MGRHTFDQVVLGSYFGLVDAYFLEFYARKRYEATLNVSVYQNHMMQAFYALVLFISCFFISQAIFINVEQNFKIPSRWWENVKTLCPKYKINDAFHYNTITGTGYMFYFLYFYGLKAYRV